MTVRAGAAAAVLVLACSHPPDEPTTCRPTFGELPRSGGLGVAGDDIALSVAISEICPSNITVTATVSAVDPDNLPVPLLEGEATRTADADRLLNVFRTTIRVHAAKPGPYHFTAHFDPNLGTVQADVLVAENLRDAGPELVVPGGGGLASCAHLDLAESGRPLCLTGDVRLFERDGGLVQTLGTGQSARVGDVLWFVKSGELTRWRETPAGFIPDPDAGLALQGIAPIIAADGDSLFLASQFGELHSVGADAGQLLERQHPNASAVSPVALWKAGSEFLDLGVRDQGGGIVQVDLCGGTVGTLKGCQTFSKGFGSVVLATASEPAGLWTISQTASSRFVVSVLSLHTGATSRDFELPEPWTADTDGGFVPWDTGAQIVDDSGTRLFVIDRHGTFVLQGYPKLPVQSVTSRWLTLRAPNGSLLIYRR